MAKKAGNTACSGLAGFCGTYGKHFSLGDRRTGWLRRVISAPTWPPEGHRDDVRHTVLRSVQGGAGKQSPACAEPVEAPAPAPVSRTPALAGGARGEHAGLSPPDHVPISPHVDRVTINPAALFASLEIRQLSTLRLPTRIIVCARVVVDCGHYESFWHNF
jgi:hypothetical protein